MLMAVQFSITEETRPRGIRHLTAQGRVSTTEAPILEKKLNDALSFSTQLLILNMSCVEYLSSIGIRVLLAVYKKALKTNSKFRVENPSENVKNVLGMVALDDLLLK
jgi:anti-anti-sigma factor